MNRIVFCVVALFLLVSFGCAPSPRQQLVDIGIFGEHELKMMERFNAVSGNFQGGFFDSVDGSIESDPKLQFFWEPKPGELVASSLPYNKLRFVVDKKEVPTIEFIFDSNWVDDKWGVERYLDSAKLNVNNFVTTNKLSVAIVRISKETLEREVYLPKSR